MEIPVYMLTMLLALALAPAGPQKPDTFTAQIKLQGLYDEIGEAITHATPAAQGVETLRTVLYTPDWEFIDASGRHQSWQQASAASEATFHATPFDAIRHAIQRLTLKGDEATVVVKVTVETDQSHVDAHATQMPQFRDQTMTFRDTWVRSGDTWKMKSREQVGKPETHAAALY